MVARRSAVVSRSDCPLVTLSMALDVSGFPRRTQVFAGNVSEPPTLAQMIRDMGAVKGATIVMDAGIASEANLDWLREQGLSKPRGTREVGKIMERIGRAKQRFSRAAQHYEVEVTQDAANRETQRARRGCELLHAARHPVGAAACDADDEAPRRPHRPRAARPPGPNHANRSSARSWVCSPAQVAPSARWCSSAPPAQRQRGVTQR